ncbi:MAG: phosphoadenosine phosphosulfate reductase family protein, partial [Candidatus Cloacimonetes bacterium]|nr:phosphoadenosine phosphosulfate reductase family protein [Candidatus Cloacimonadota bacterium]
MYKIKCLEGSNLPKLTDNLKVEDAFFALRPVFFEELDLLGFDKKWIYPKSEAPLLWASGRRYFYKGCYVAEVSGGDIFTAPVVNIFHEGTLKPINIEELANQNLKQLLILENEAKLFVNNVYKNRDDTSFLTVSFSGGKDSQAVLDLVMQVVPPEDFVVVYNDTGMEMPYVSELIEQSIRNYSELGSPLKFIVSNTDKDILQLWNNFGPPTRKHRWCCTVCKTAPFVNLINTLNVGNGLVINFAGIRSEESATRKSYERINIIGKHRNVSSIHPIFNWSSFEVYLYLMYKGIRLNKGYRYGLSRVGCSVCPFSSPLSEYINYKLYPTRMGKLLNVIKASLLKGRVKESEIDNYLQEKNWAKIIRSESITDFSSKYMLQIQSSDCVVTTNITAKQIFFGFSILSNFRMKAHNESYQMEFICNNTIVYTEIAKEHDMYVLVFKNIGSSPTIIGVIKRILNRLVYCVGCRGCEVECPTGALSMVNQTVDLNICSHCLKCLTAFDYGCLNANYRINIKGESQVNSIGALNRYWGFGIRNEWLYGFFIDHDSWMTNNTLGEIQY